MTGNTMEPDAGLFFPKLMMGYKDVNIFPLYGQLKNTGSIDAPIFPTNGIAFLVAAIGYDGGNTGLAGAGTGYGVTGTALAGLTDTLAAGTAVAATTITVASIKPTVGQYIQIDVNSTVTPTTSEVRQVATSTGSASPYTVTFTAPLVYSHASGATVTYVQSPFTHTIQQANTLPSLTVEKNIGGFESLQFSGARVNKYDMKCTTGDDGINATIDMVAQAVNILTSPSAISVTDEYPFVFAEVTLDLFGTSLTQGTSFSLSIDNALKSTYTYNQTHGLQFLTPVTRHISGELEVVYFNSGGNADTTYDYLLQYLTGFQGTNSTLTGGISFTVAHTATEGEVSLNGTPQGLPTALISGESITINLPQCNISKYADDVKMDDVVMSTLGFEASLDLNAALAAPTTISATVVNAVCTAY